MTLFNLSPKYRQLLDMLESGEYEEEELADTLEMMTAEEAENLGKIALTLADNVTKIDAELDRLRGRKAAMKKGLDQVKSTLMLCMDKAGTRRIATATMTISIRKNPPTVVTADGFIDCAEQSGRDDLLRYARPEPDKRKIMDAIKAGDEIPAEIVQREGVVIK